MSEELPDSWDDEPWPLDDPLGSPFQPKTWSDSVEDVPQPNELADEAWEYAVDYGVSLERALAEVQARRAGPIPAPTPPVHISGPRGLYQQAKPISWGSYKNRIGVRFIGGPRDGSQTTNADTEYIHVAVGSILPLTLSMNQDPSAPAPRTVAYRRYMQLDRDGREWSYIYEGPNAYTFFYLGTPLPIAPIFDTRADAHRWLQKLIRSGGADLLKLMDVTLEWVLPE